MSALEQHLRGLVEAIAEEVAAKFVTAKPAAQAHVRALTRKAACAAMGIGKTKLAELIAAGVVKTVDGDPRLVPVSEVEKYCTPGRAKPRRRASPKLPEGAQNQEALRAMLDRRMK